MRGEPLPQLGEKPSLIQEVHHRIAGRGTHKALDQRLAGVITARNRSSNEMLVVGADRVEQGSLWKDASGLHDLFSKLLK